MFLRNNLERNEYLQAITAVGEILQYYDTDKQIPVFGFGAKVPPINDRAQHCFSINGDIFDPELDGLAGVIEAYKHALSHIAFYGPTHFSKVLRMVVDFAEKEDVSQLK